MKQLFLLFFLLMSVQSFAQIPKKALQYYDQARTAVASGDTEKGLELLDKAIKKHPKYLEAIGLKAKVFSELGQKEEAIELYQSVMTLAPKKEADAWFQIGKIEMADREYESALVAFEKSTSVESARKTLTAQAEERMETCRFRIEAVANPLPFSPMVLSDSINSMFSEYLPTMTVDEEKIFFTRRLGTDRFANEDFFVSEKDENGQWSLAEDLSSSINTETNEGALSLSPDGNRIFFAAKDRRDTEGGYDIYYSYRHQGQWAEPQNIGMPVSSIYWDSQPSISADGKELYFASKRKSSLGGIDLYMSTLKGNAWQQPVNLGTTINTREDEQCPFIHPDGQTLYFSSKGHLGMGDADLFMSKRQEDGSWGEPVNLGYPINTEHNEGSLIVSADGKRGYYTSYVEGKDLDLHHFEMPSAIQPEFVSFVKGLVVDAESQSPIAARVTITDLETGQVAGTAGSNNDGGSFLLSLPSGKNYAFRVEHPDYLFHSANFSLKNNPRSEPYLLNIELEKKKEGEKLVLHNIFFETGKSELLAASSIELERVVKMMQDAPNLKIEIIGHTDDVGDDGSNLRLSQSRAQSVLNYLSEKGIDGSRLSATGKGETEPIADNTTEEGRAQNRRTEFLIRNF